MEDALAEGNCVSPAHPPGPATSQGQRQVASGQAPTSSPWCPGNQPDGWNPVHKQRMPARVVAPTAHLTVHHVPTSPSHLGTARLISRCGTRASRCLVPGSPCQYAAGPQAQVSCPQAVTSPAELLLPAPRALHASHRRAVTGTPLMVLVSASQQHKEPPPKEDTGGVGGLRHILFHCNLWKSPRT